MLYQECRKKPLQSASSAPTLIASQKLKTAGPPAPAAPPLRVRPTTADVADLTAPKAGQSAFRSVTEPQPVKPRSQISALPEQDEAVLPSGRAATPLEQQIGSPFAATQQAQPPLPLGPIVRSAFDGSPDDEQHAVAEPAARVEGVPSLEEAQQQMAAAPMLFMPPESMMRANPRSSLSWRAPSQMQLQFDPSPNAAGTDYKIQ